MRWIANGHSVFGNGQSFGRRILETHTSWSTWSKRVKWRNAWGEVSWGQAFLPVLLEYRPGGPYLSLFHRKHRQGDEGAGAGVHFQGHGGEPPLPNCIATHRPREVGRIDAGERRVEEPGRLPVSLQRNGHGVEQHALSQQFAPQRARTRFQVVERDPGGDSSLLATHREEGVADGWAGPLEWLPPSEAFACEYLLRFARVADRYDLNLRPEEVAALEQLTAQKCD